MSVTERVFRAMGWEECAFLPFDKVRVYWSGPRYYSSERFDSLHDAIRFVRDKGQAAQFHRGLEVLGEWSALGGFRALSDAGNEGFGHKVRLNPADEFLWRRHGNYRVGLVGCKRSLGRSEAQR